MPDRVLAWLPAELAEAVLASGRSQVSLARDSGLSEKHVSQMLTGKVDGSFAAWHALLDAAGVSISLRVIRVLNEADRMEQEERP